MNPEGLLITLAPVVALAWLGNRKWVRALLLRDPLPSRAISVGCVGLLVIGILVVTRQGPDDASDNAWLVMLLPLSQFIVVGVGLLAAAAMPGRARATALAGSLMVMIGIGLLNVLYMWQSAAGNEADIHGNDYRGPVLRMTEVVAALTLLVPVLHRLPAPHRSAGR